MGRMCERTDYLDALVYLMSNIFMPIYFAIS